MIGGILFFWGNALLVGFAHALQLCDHKLVELQRCRWLRH